MEAEIERQRELRLVLGKAGDKGRGVFTTEPIASGEVILCFKGAVFDIDDIRDELGLYIQVGPREFQYSSGDIDDFVNHSCEPNSGYRVLENIACLVAIEPIAAGAEITYDYSTTMMGGFYEMNCKCGAKTCRGRVTDFAALPEPVKLNYMQYGIVPEFILKG